MSFILIFGTLLIGCTPAKPATQAQLDEIATKCGLDTKTFVLETPSRARIQPNVDANFKAFDCGLSEIRKIPGLEFGFVGNEMYQADANGNPIKEGDGGY
ncbi:hypothetical protein [Parasphingorhabdus sp.]|uniref:hypothetical protein n=1 Tax=Parasphingorhabdus sp. TaxID=2709688 RepID=UPI0032EE7F8F